MNLIGSFVFADCCALFNLTIMFLVMSSCQEIMPRGNNTDMDDIHQLDTNDGDDIDLDKANDTGKCTPNDNINYNLNETNTIGTADSRGRNMFENDSRKFENTTFTELFLDVIVESCPYYECSSQLGVCRCDSICLLYGDCCYEYLEKHLAESVHETNISDVLWNGKSIFQSLVLNETFTKEIFIYEHSSCIWDEKKVNAFWMINKCPKQFANDTITRKCERETYYGLKNIPIEWTDSDGRQWLFRNIFCLLCHGIDLDENIQKWKIEVSCSGENMDEVLIGNINLFDLGSNCEAEVISASKNYRMCKGTQSVDTQCENTPEPQGYTVLCNHYVFLVKQNQSLYRNPHCAICDADTLSYRAYCPLGFIFEDQDFKRVVDLQLLFDFNLDSGFTVQASCVPVIECLYFEVYDCITERCRPLYCSDNQIPYFGNCISSNSTISAEYWFEEVLPKDVNGIITNLIYVKIDVLTVSPLPENKVFHLYLGQLNIVQQIVNVTVDINRLDLNSAETGSEIHFQEPNLGEEIGERVGTWNTNEHRIVQNDPKTDVNTDIHGTILENHESNTQTRWPTDKSNVAMTDMTVETEGNIRNHQTKPFTESPRVDLTTHGLSADLSNIPVQNDIPTFEGTTATSFRNGDFVHQNKWRNGIPQDEINDGQEHTKGPTTALYHCTYTATLIVKSHAGFAAQNIMKLFKHLNSKGENIFDNSTDINITARTYTSLRNLRCDDGNLTFEFNVSFAENTKEIKLMSKQHTALMANVYWSLSAESAERNALDTIAVCLVKLRIPSMNCNMTVYEKREVYFVNSTMHVKNTTMSYVRSEYVMVGNKIFVCVDKLGLVSYIRFFSYSRFQRVLTIVSSSVSLICLIAICIMHGIFSKLRNKHGLNLFALSSCMVLMHAMLLIDTTPVGNLCVVFAAFLHFILLKMFVWMCIIGIDMAVTFYSKTLSQNTKNMARFLKCFVIAVALPLIIVALCLSLDYSKATLRPGYGDGEICWLTNSAGIITFFILPVCVSVTLNLIMFTVTFCSIQSAKINSAVKTSRNRTYCLVYFKLSIILGFTWIVSILAAFVSVQWLWYIHIVLNGLQGLSIFLCTMVNARTTRIFKESTKAMTFSETKLSKVSNSI